MADLLASYGVAGIGFGGPILLPDNPTDTQPFADAGGTSVPYSNHNVKLSPMGQYSVADPGDYTEIESVGLDFLFLCGGINQNAGVTQGKWPTPAGFTFQVFLQGPEGTIVGGSPSIVGWLRTISGSGASTIYTSFFRARALQLLPNPIALRLSENLHLSVTAQITLPLPGYPDAPAWVVGGSAFSVNFWAIIPTTTAPNFPGPILGLDPGQIPMIYLYGSRKRDTYITRGG